VGQPQLTHIGTALLGHRIDDSLHLSEFFLPHGPILKQVNIHKLNDQVYHVVVHFSESAILCD